MDTSQSVLVVDDFRSMTTILRKLLNGLGFADVDHVLDGNAALESLRAKRHKLVISDWEMQPMTGPQLVQAIRKMPALADTPVILVTVHQFRQDESKSVGADGYLVKPFTATVLRDMLDRVLSVSAIRTKAK